MGLASAPSAFVADGVIVWRRWDGWSRCGFANREDEKQRENGVNENDRGNDFHAAIRSRLTRCVGYRGFDLISMSLRS
jgi:hypothetical protein